MKKISFFIVLLLTLSLFSCSKKEEQSKEMTRDKVISYSIKMGKAHNIGLDYLVKTLNKKNSIGYFRNTSSISKEELRDKSVVYIKTIDDYNNLELSVKQKFNTITDTILDCVVNSTVSHYPINVDSSSELGIYFNRLKVILDDNDNDIVNLINRTNVVIQDATNNITDNTTLLSVLVAAEIQKNSFIYWQNNSNMNKWIAIFNNNQSAMNTQRRFNWPWKSLARDDMEGAIGSAIGLVTSGEITIVATPGGVAAAGMIIAAGGIGNSAVGFYNWYLDNF